MDHAMTYGTVDEPCQRLEAIDLAASESISL